jgi:hypothetical protein
MIRNISNPKSDMFYPFCHIAYLLSFDKVDFLIEKNIFKAIIKLLEDSESVMISFVSDIIFNTVQFGLENNKILQILYFD